MLTLFVIRERIPISRTNLVGNVLSLFQNQHISAIEKEGFRKIPIRKKAVIGGSKSEECCRKRKICRSFSLHRFRMKKKKKDRRKLSSYSNKKACLSLMRMKNAR